MPDEAFSRVKYLAFDIFGTVMDLTGSLSDPVGDFLAARGSDMSGEAFYADWRDRQRIEQYQDNLVDPGTQRVPRDLPPGVRLLPEKAQRQIHGRSGTGVHQGIQEAAAFRRRHSRIAGAGEALQAGSTLEWGTVVP